MVVVTTFLCLLLACGLFLAARELAGFQPEPEWRNVTTLRERLACELEPAPAHHDSSRGRTIDYCLELRREFRSAWRLCRFLAPITGDPGYIGTLVAVKARFYLTLGRALLCAFGGLAPRCNCRLEELRQLSTTMRSSALAILMQSDFENGFSPA